MGYQSSPLTRSLFYAEPAWKPSFPLASTTWEAQIKVRGWVDTLPGGFQSELSIRAFSLSTSRNRWRLVAGFQEIVWGETFGYPILDLVSPRDYRDPLLLDSNWVRLPVASLNAQFFLGKTTLQAVMTPFARSALFPTSGSAIDPTPTLGIPGVSLSSVSTANISTLGTGSEWGGRVSHLFESGMDLGLIYYHHWNRNPVYKIISGSAGSILITPLEQKVDTLGGTLSTTLGNLVLRADQALHLGQPLQGGTLGALETGTQWQSVLGADVTSENGWTLGLQFQSTFDFMSSGNRSFTWLSSRANKKFLDGKLEADFFLQAGLNNPDLWLQPKVTWNLGDSWSLAVRADWIAYRGGSPSQGYLWLVRDQSRVFAWISYKI